MTLVMLVFYQQEIYCCEEGEGEGPYNKLDLLILINNAF